ncbi:MAG: excinuclease ABC subunit UvrA, partial [Candidatus Heimdallarchaeaceae archaeon]
MGKDSIKVEGANENNLRNVSVEIPHDKLVVISGISGSGKSSLAFNTIFMEAQRRYMETLSAYARQFIGNFDRPDVEHIDGLRPTISIDQKTISRNPRSTVGTLTEIFDYMRVLFARVGIPHCPACKVKIEAQPSEQIIEQIFASFEGDRIKIIAPMFEKRKGEYRKELAQWKEDGYNRLIIDGKEVNLDDEEVALERYVAHDIDIIIDRNKCERRNEPSIRDSVTLALELSNGKLHIIGEGKARMFSTKLVCPTCGIAINEFNPRDFSYNTPVGACQRCRGLGKNPQIVSEKFVNKKLSIKQGAIATTTSSGNYITYSGIGMKSINSIIKKHGFDTDTILEDLTEEQLNILLYGAGNEEFKVQWEWGTEDTTWKGQGEYMTKWKGLIPATMEAYYRVKSKPRKELLEKFMDLETCNDCKGNRLKPESLAVLFNGKNIAELNRLSIDKCLKFFDGIKLQNEEKIIAGPLVKEIRNRLSFLMEVGLHYITLDRAANELSGGEAQRTRLATQIGSKLQGVNYILDEPSIGLANRDNAKLLSSLIRLRDGRNSVIVVEHDEDTMRNADILLDIGPYAGEKGGEILFSKDPKQLTLEDAEKSVTARYLLGQEEIAVPKKRRKSNKFLELKGATHNNLKKIDVKFPLQSFIGITGVSGSGKSSLISDTLYPILVNELHNGSKKIGKYKSINGIENLDKAVVIDQSPIGRSSRSNPATYTKLLDPIRDLFAKIPTAKIRGYTKTRFTFNTKEGRCEACKGHGYNKIEMTLLPDVEVECEICKGRRFDDETLKIKFAKYSIADVLDMTVSKASKVFENQPKIARILETLCDVGLDYIKLGQPSTTISGGEAQRIKLSRELSKRDTGNTLYILDEPTTGLSFMDIKKLLKVLHRIVDKNNTIIIIEHNLDVIKTVDYLIDLGPEGGEEQGGFVVATGTPEEIMTCEESYTGQALKKVFIKDYKPEEIEPSSYLDEGLDPSNYLYVRGATKNNLKNIDIDIPKEKLVVITGPSGSGKSSLAIDTLFAEGQRRFVESLSSYARQFLVRAERGDVEDIIGLTPSIAIDQHSISKNPRSTVATTTEIYDYLRLLYAKVGIPHCPKCGIVLQQRTVTELNKLILKDFAEENIIVASSLSNGETIDVQKAIKELAKEGYARALIDDKEYHLDEVIKKRKAKSLSAIIDRMKIDKEQVSRLSEAIEIAVKLGKGRVEIHNNGKKKTYSIYAECIDHDYEAYEEMHPRLFSFNHYSGACATCTGLGSIRKLDMRKIITDWDKSIVQGAIGPYSVQRMTNPSSWRRNMLKSIGDHFGFTVETPMKDLTPQQLDVLFYGSKGEIIKLKIQRERERSSSEFIKTAEWEGLIPRWEKWLADPTDSKWGIEYKQKYNKYFTEYHCPDCSGHKLKPEILAITVGDRSIYDLSTVAVDDFLTFLNTLKLNKRERKIADRIIAELTKRAEYLVDVGLSYLTLNRRSSTLSNGEAQRIRLASQIGSGLVGVTYVLDEPTIG